MSWERDAGLRLRSDALAGGGVEDMRHILARLEPDHLARREMMAFAEQRQDIAATDMHEHHGFRAGRLDDADLALETVVGEIEMFRPDPVGDVLAFRDPMAGADRQQRAVGVDESLPANDL